MVKGTKTRLVTAPFALRGILLMTLMPDADYTEVMTALAGDLAAMPWAASWHVPSPRVFSAWRQAIGPGPLETVQEASLSNFLCKLGQSLSFCYIIVGSFRRPGQTGTRLGNVTANAFMAAFQPRVPVPRCPLSRTSPSPSMWRPVTFLIPR